MNAQERRNIMPKYLMLWSLDKAYIPADSKERGGGWSLLMELVKQDLKKGVSKDWGLFPSEGAGYCILEGTNVEIMKTTEQYVPYVDFETYPIASVDEAHELVQALSE
jgi:hypothetical protein